MTIYYRDARTTPGVHSLAIYESRILRPRIPTMLRHPSYSILDYHIYICGFAMEAQQQYTQSHIMEMSTIANVI